MAPLMVSWDTRKSELYCLCTVHATANDRKPSNKSITKGPKREAPGSSDREGES